MLLERLRVPEWIWMSLIRNIGESSRWIMGGIYAALIFRYYQRGPDAASFVIVFVASIIILAVAFALIDAAFDPDQPGDLYGIFEDEKPDP